MIFMNKYMQVAKELADDNLKTNVGGPFGAVVVRNGEIIGRGSNHVLANNDPTAHGEVMAIRDACKNIGSYDLTGCEIYTSTYPCPMCMSAIIWSNVKKVYYGNTKEDAADIGFRDDFIYDYINKLVGGEKDNNTLDLEEMDREETIESFKAFKNKDDKTIY
jgi:tRNA(Arg) A34 adenosine deaminase TadA